MGRRRASTPGRTRADTTEFLKIYNLAFLNEKMSEIWKSENADIDATVLKQWIETAERVALGEMWKVMLEHDFL